jgi:parallel beta-helix repeat protein
MRLLAVVLSAIVLTACGHQAGTAPGALSAEDLAFENALQKQLLEARPGTLIEVPAGKHQLDHPLILHARGVALRGAGIDKSTLSFKGATAGAGIIVLANDVVIEALSIEDSRGSALEADDVEGLTLRNLRVAWTRGPQPSNGAYGIQLRGARRALLEDCGAYSAAADGIRIADSREVVVRRCHVEQNVAGIELDNTGAADLYENMVTGNSSGIVVAYLPGARFAARGTRIFRNQIYKNNLDNFAAHGAAAAALPTGAGVVAISAKALEIFDNDIADNRTANLIIWETLPGMAAAAAPFDAYTRALYVYGNRFTRGGDSPYSAELKALKSSLFGAAGHLPDVVWDGQRDEQAPAAARLCLDNGAATVLNIRTPAAAADTGLRCQLPKLPAVMLPGRI